MELEYNKENVISKPYDPSVPTADDYGWWETVGLQIDQSALVDTSFSENLQYNKTAAHILGYTGVDAEDANSKWDATIDMITGSGFNSEKVDIMDKLIDNGAVKFDDKGELFINDKEALSESKFHQLNDLKTWWKVKQKGYSAQSFKKEVQERTRQEYMELAKKIQVSDSTSAEIMGGMSVWLSDPVSASLLVGEIGLYMLTKSKAGSIAVGNLLAKTQIGRNVKRAMGVKGIRKMTRLIENRADEVYRTRKEIAVKKIGHIPWQEYRNFTKALEKKGLDPKMIAEAVRRRIASGKFKHTDEIKKLIRYNKNKEIKDIAIDVSFYGMAGIATETINQLNIYDFKNGVLPEYTKEDAIASIGISGLIGAGAGGTVDVASRWWTRKKVHEAYDVDAIKQEIQTGSGVPELVGVESTPEMYEQMVKANSDSINGDWIDVDGAPDVAKEFEIDFDSFSEAEVEEFVKKAEQDPEWLESPENKTIESEIQSYEKIKQCIMGSDTKRASEDTIHSTDTKQFNFNK